MVRLLSRFRILICLAVFMLIPVVPASADSQEKTVRVLLEDTAWHRNIENTVHKFEKLHNTKVKLKFLPEVPERKLVDKDLTSGSGMFDVFLTDEMYIQKFAKLGALVPLDEFANNDKDFIREFATLALSTHTHKGKLYGIPWRTAMNILAYRKDILKKYGIRVPGTYAELEKAAVRVRQLLKKDGHDDIYGIISRGIRGEGLNMWIIGSSIFPAWGGRWFDSSGRPSVNSPEMVAALDYYAGILRRAGHPDASKHSWQDCAELYSQGKGVFFIDSAIQISLLYDKGGFVAENTGVSFIPRGPRGVFPGLYSPAYIMSAKAENRNLAWEFIKWATSYEQMLSDAVDGGNYEIANLSVRISPEFRKRYPYPQLNEVFFDSSYVAKEERPMILKWTEIGNITGEFAEKAIAGEMDAESALNEAQKRIMKIYNENPKKFH